MFCVKLSLQLKQQKAKDLCHVMEDVAKQQVDVMQGKNIHYS